MRDLDSDEFVNVPGFPISGVEEWRRKYFRAPNLKRSCFKTPPDASDSRVEGLGISPERKARDEMKCTFGIIWSKTRNSNTSPISIVSLHGKSEGTKMR